MHSSTSTADTVHHETSDDEEAEAHAEEEEVVGFQREQHRFGAFFSPSKLLKSLDRKETELQEALVRISELEDELTRLACKEGELDEAREHIAELELEREQHRVNHETFYENAEEVIALEREQHRLDMAALQQQVDEAHELLAGARLKKTQNVFTDLLLKTQLDEQVARAEASEAMCEQMRAISEALEHECAQLREQLHTFWASRDATDASSQQDGDITTVLRRQLEEQTARADALDQRCKELLSRAAHLEQQCANATAALQRKVEEHLETVETIDDRCEESRIQLEKDSSSITLDLQRQVEKQTARANELEHSCEQLRSRAAELERKCAALQAELATNLKTTAAEKVDVPSSVGADLVRHSSSGVAEEDKSAGPPLKHVKCATEAGAPKAASGHVKHESSSVSDAAENSSRYVRDGIQEQSGSRALYSEQEFASTTTDLQQQVEQQTARADKLQHSCEELRSRAADLEQECAALKAALTTALKSTEDEKVDGPSFVGADLVRHSSSRVAEEDKSAGPPLKHVKCAPETGAPNGASGHVKRESCSVNEAAEDVSRTKGDGIQEQSRSRAVRLEQEYASTTTDLQQQVERQTARANELEHSCEELRCRAAELERECANTTADLRRQLEEQTVKADTLDRRCEELRSRAAHLEQQCANTTTDLQRQLEEQPARVETLDQRCEQSRSRAVHSEQEFASTATDLQRQVEQQTARADKLEHSCEQLRSRAAELEQECAGLKAALTTNLKTTEADKVAVPSSAGADVVSQQSSAVAEKSKSAGPPSKQSKCAPEAGAPNRASGHVNKEKEAAQDASKTVSQLAAEVLNKVDSEFAKISDEIHSSVDNLSKRMAKLALEPEIDAESLRPLSRDFSHDIAFWLQTFSERINEVRRRYAGRGAKLKPGSADGASQAAARATSEAAEIKQLRAELKAISKLKDRADGDIADLHEQVDRLFQELKAERTAKLESGRGWFCTR